MFHRRVTWPRDHLFYPKFAINNNLFLFLSFQSPTKSTKKSKSSSVSSNGSSNGNGSAVDIDVDSLNDDELYAELSVRGVKLGPVVESTRVLYREDRFPGEINGFQESSFKLTIPIAVSTFLSCPQFANLHWLRSYSVRDKHTSVNEMFCLSPV